MVAILCNNDEKLEKNMKKEEIFKRFDNIKAFEAYLAKGTTLPGMSDEATTGSYSFCKTHSYHEANDLLLYGDKNLQKKIMDMGLAKLKTNLNKYVVRRQTFTAVQGFAPHVANYIAGVPNSMINARMKHIKQNVVTVYYNSAVSGNVEASSIMESVAKLCCALIRLEAQGIRTNVYAGTLGHEDTQSVCFSVKIKSSGQPFDTLKMMYPLAHPSFNRRHKFRFVEVTEGVKPKEWRYGYGSSERDDAKTKEFLERHGLKVDRCFNYKSVQYATVESIMKMITNYK